MREAPPLQSAMVHLKRPPLCWAGAHLCCLSSLPQWTAWTPRVQAEVSACEASATALWGGEAATVRHPGPRAWTSAQAMEPSSQTPGFAAVTQAGLDMTAPSVSCGEKSTVGTWGGPSHGDMLTIHY